MTTETMTAHKALTELKVIDECINKAISGTTFTCANKHSNEKISGLPIQDYREYIKSCYQKATDLINRRNALR